MSTVDLIRSLNLVLAVLAFAWLVERRIHHPDWYPRGGLRRDIWVMAFLWDLSLLVATAELLLDSGTYIRVVLSTGAVLTTLAILARPRADWPPPKHRGDG